jgi:3-carboxy-cis,cis-muconate cycloisomerase
MPGTIFERTLVTADIEAVFADAAVIDAMLAFEAALAGAEADEGVVPAAAAAAIAAACGREAFDVEAIVAEARIAGALAIPLVSRLKAQVGVADPGAARFVHHGATSQDAIDTALVLVTRRALALIDADLSRLIDALTDLARRHATTPMLGRTLLQPAEVTSFGCEVLGWLVPLVDGRRRLRDAADAAIRLQFGGAVGTLAVLGERAPAVARGLAARLALASPAGAWHASRDAWVALGCALALLCGSLGKMGRDLALLAQGEVGEVAEPHGEGRGSSSAMPHKRNPVAALVAISAATRAPHFAAALLAAMPQEHQRGLGGWQAELATWAPLCMATHGAVRALADACAAGLAVDAARMRRNIDRHVASLDAASAARIDVDAAARHAGRVALTQLDALTSITGTPSL